MRAWWRREDDAPVEAGRVLRGDLICVMVSGRDPQTLPCAFAMVVVPAPGDALRLWSTEGRLVFESDAVVATLDRNDRLYVKTRTAVYRIVAADANPSRGVTGELGVLFDDD